MTSRFGLEIRAATAADASSLATLLAEFGHFLGPHELADRIVALRKGSSTALLALQWGPPSGLLVMHWYRTLEADRPIAQISTLLVGLEDRRRGIGRLLVKAAAQAARSARCSELEIRSASDTPSLHAFCRATGFAEHGSLFVRSLRKQP